MAYPNSIGAAGLARTDVPPSTALGAIEGRLHELAASMDDGSSRLDRLADRICGSVPSPSDGTAGPEAVPNGAISNINRIIDRLFAKAQDTSATIARLDSVA